MKRFLVFIAATTSLMLLTPACWAKADSLGINKDCESHPVSDYGMTSITAFSQYQAESKKITDAMTSFCNKGKSMGDMGFGAASDQSETESRQWSNANLPGQSDEQKAFRDTTAHLLYYAMLNGFSGFDYPKAPEQNNAPPVTGFSPYETCNAISSDAAEYSTSQLPPNVKISLSEWKQIKSEFEMICLAGVMNGNGQKPVDKKLMAGLNDIARDVYLQSYKIGSTHPKLSSPEQNDAVREKKNATERAVKEKRNAAIIQQNRKDREKQMVMNHQVQQSVASLRNAVMQRMNHTTDFSGKKCSVKVWLSQKGEVLSAEDESGDAGLCSAALQATKGVKINSMSDDVYNVLRNVTLNFDL